MGGGSVPENGRKSRKMKSIVQDLSEKIMACMPNNKFLEWSKLKAFADNKINEKKKVCLGWVKNIVAKGENAGNQHFLPFPQCFQKASF